ncbi:MAG: hypothetical protein IJZ82_06290 [Lachnospiraceae bacterium]|nr:hypothetical protein [Lachnospiraceae bacterium]
MSKTTKRLLFTIVLLLGLCLWGVFRFLLSHGHHFNIYIFPPSPQRYVAIALDYMDNGIYAEGDAWKAKKVAIMKRAENLENYADTHELLNEALVIAGGKHSVLLTVNAQDALIAEQENPTVSLDADGILYVKLPAFAGTEGAREYADKVVDFVEENEEEIKGVIIDLQDNTGGNLGPMLAAVSPFLPEGQLLSFRIKEKDQPVALSDGSVTGGGSNMLVDEVEIDKVPVAILQNEWTASSGEAVLLAFRGLDYAKTFGSSTAGYCSCNTVHYLYDGAMMQLTVGSNVARTGEEFCEVPILPEVETETPLEAAKKWILE